MAHLKVNSQAMKQTAASMKQICDSLRTISESVDGAKQGLQAGSENFLSGIERKLGVYHQKIIEEAAQMDSLAAALDYIAEQYQTCEQKLCQTTRTEQSYADTTGNRSEEKPKENWLDTIKRWIERLREENDKRSAKAAERAQDKYMQGQVFDLLDQKQFKKRTWKKASVEERKSILNAFMREVSRIMGISISGDIEFASLGENTRGGYTSESNSIRINVDRLGEAGSYALIQTIIHEMRHAYQHQVVEHPENFSVTQETVEQWRNNFEHYRSMSEYGYDSYVTQPIEYDAKKFAKQYGDVFSYKPDYAGSWG